MRVSAVFAMKTFPSGMFYGDFARRRRVGAIELAELRPIVPEHEVETHSHDDARTADYAELLFEQAMLAEGGHLDDPAAFIARMNRLLVG